MSEPPPPPPVVKDHVGPAVVPPLETAVIFQKYVVFVFRLPGLNDAEARPVATCGGFEDVPKLTLNVVPGAPAAHVSAGFVLTPVEPFAGFGFDGAAGGPDDPPAVVNDQVDELATSDGLTTVAFVRATTFQKIVVPPGRFPCHEYCDGGLFTS